MVSVYCTSSYLAVFNIPEDAALLCGASITVDVFQPVFASIEVVEALAEPFLVAVEYQGSGIIIVFLGSPEDLAV